MCAGLAGLYFVKNSTDVGVGPDRWGLDGMEEYHLMLADRVVDRQCQLRYEPEVRDEAGRELLVDLHLL
jgi:hypothetical protein